jgi:hypothetical protein
MIKYTIHLYLIKFTQTKSTQTKSTQTKSTQTKSTQTKSTQTKSTQTKSTHTETYHNSNPSKLTKYDSMINIILKQINDIIKNEPSMANYKLLDSDNYIGYQNKLSYTLKIIYNKYISDPKIKDLKKIIKELNRLFF